MAIGGYTTAILMTDHGVKDIVTIPLAIVVAGGAGMLFGLPAARLSGLYLALATFAVAVATPAVIKKFEGFTGGGSGVNLFGTPELTASLTPVRILGFELNFNNWLYYLVLDGCADRLRDRVADSPWSDGPCVPGSPRQRDRCRFVGNQPDTDKGARVRDQCGVRRRSRSVVCNRDDIRQSGHLPGRPLDLSPRGRRRLGTRLVDRAHRRCGLHSVHAPVGPERLEVAGRARGRLRRHPDPLDPGLAGWRIGPHFAGFAVDAGAEKPFRSPNTRGLPSCESLVPMAPVS